MRRENHNHYLIFAFIIFLSLSLTFNLQLSDKFNSDTMMVKYPKNSKISPPFQIIGNTGWASFYAEGNCTGAGISISPYIISDLIIDAGGSGSGIIIQNSDVYFEIRNCTIWNTGSSFGNAGISLIGVGNGTIENNTLYDNWHGVRLDNSDNNLILNNTILGYFNIGIYFYANSFYNTVSKNIIKNGNHAVQSISSINPTKNITIYNNTMISNTYGMDLKGVNHTITDNLLKENLYGIRIDDGADSKIFRNTIIESRDGGIGLYVLDSDYVKIVNNTINYGELYAFNLVRCDYSVMIGNTVSYNDNTGVTIASSSYVMFLNNTISFNAGSGFFLNGGVATTNYNKVLNNIIHNNGGTGVGLGSSNYNNISNNEVHHNGAYGITMGSSSFNNISHNIFKDDAGGPYGSEIYVTGNNNLIFANYFIYASLSPGRDSGGFNEWNSSSIGNYWSSYSGVDANEDGIGDTPFNVHSGDYDFLPIWWDSPQILINSPNQDDTFESSPSFSISVSRGMINSSWYTFDNGNTNITFIGLSGVIDSIEWNEAGVGQIDLTFYVNDSRGFIGSETVQVMKSYDTPQITINSPTLNEVIGFSAPDFNITVNDLSPINATWYTIDGGLTNYTSSVLTGTLNQIVWETKGTEIITLRFYANDSLGYVGFKDVDILKDLIAPNIVINSPIQDVTFGSTSPEFNISIIEENLVSTWYTIEGVAGSFTFTSLNGTIDQGGWDSVPQGEISITFNAEDGAGNIGSKEVIVIKSIPSQPEIPGFNIIALIGVTLAVTLILTKRKFKK